MNAHQGGSGESIWEKLCDSPSFLRETLLFSAMCDNPIKDVFLHCCCGHSWNQP